MPGFKEFMSNIGHLGHKDPTAYAKMDEAEGERESFFAAVGHAFANVYHRALSVLGFHSHNEKPVKVNQVKEMSRMEVEIRHKADATSIHQAMMKAGIMEVMAKSGLPSTLDRGNFADHEHTKIARDLEDFIEDINMTGGELLEQKKLPIARRTEAYKYLEDHKEDFAQMKNRVVLLEKNVEEVTKGIKSSADVDLVKCKNEIQDLKAVLRAVPLIKEKAEHNPELELIAFIKHKKEKVEKQLRELSENVETLSGVDTTEYGVNEIEDLNNLIREKEGRITRLKHKIETFEKEIANLKDEFSAPKIQEWKNEKTKRRAEKDYQEVRRKMAEKGLAGTAPQQGVFGTPLPLHLSHPLPQFQNQGWVNYAPQGRQDVNAPERAEDSARIQAMARDIELSLPDSLDGENLLPLGYKHVVNELEVLIAEINSSPGQNLDLKKLPVARRNEVYRYLEDQKGVFNDMRKDVASNEKDLKDVADMSSEIEDLTNMGVLSKNDKARLVKLQEEKKALLLKIAPELREIDEEIGELLGGFDLASAELSQDEMNVIAGKDPELYEKVFDLTARKKELEQAPGARYKSEISTLKSVLRAVTLIRAKAEDTSELERLAYLKFKKKEIETVIEGSLEDKLDSLDDEIEDKKEEINEGNLTDDEVQDLQKVIVNLQNLRSAVENLIGAYGEDLELQKEGLHRAVETYDQEIAALKAELSIE